MIPGSIQPDSFEPGVLGVVNEPAAAPTLYHLEISDDGDGDLSSPGVGT